MNKMTSFSREILFDDIIFFAQSIQRSKPASSINFIKLLQVLMWMVK